MRCHRWTMGLGICVLVVMVVGISLFCMGTFGLCPKCLALGLHGQPGRPTQGCVSAPVGRCPGVPAKQTLKKVVFFKGFGLPQEDMSLWESECAPGLLKAGEFKEVAHVLKLTHLWCCFVIYFFLNSGEHKNCVFHLNRRTLFYPYDYRDCLYNISLLQHRNRFTSLQLIPYYPTNTYFGGAFPWFLEAWDWQFSLASILCVRSLESEIINLSSVRLCN